MVGTFVGLRFSVSQRFTHTRVWNCHVHVPVQAIWETCVLHREAVFRRFPQVPIKRKASTKAEPPNWIREGNAPLRLMTMHSQMAQRWDPSMSLHTEIQSDLEASLGIQRQAAQSFKLIVDTLIVIFTVWMALTTVTMDIPIPGPNLVHILKWTQNLVS